MRKFLLSAAAVLSMAGAANAQRQVDILTLSNGGELVGDVVVRDSTELVFRTADGTLNKWIALSDIAGERRGYLDEGYVVPEPSSRGGGYGAFVEFRAGLGGMNLGTLDLSTSQGWFIGPDLFVGISAGARWQAEFSPGAYVRSTGTLSIPVSLTGRYYFLNSRKCSPYVDLKAGYSVPLQDALYWPEDNSYNRRGYREKGLFACLTGGVELGRFSVHAGVTLSSLDCASFSEGSYVNFMSGRWRNCTSLYRYLHLDACLGVGFRF